MLQPSSTPLLIVLSAPSGAGKTTLCQQLLIQNPSITRAVTCTTRQRRHGEWDGIDYHFLSTETFQQHIDQRRFLEHAQVFGNAYGTLKSEVLDRLARGSDVLLNIDVQGAEAVRARSLEDPILSKSLVSIFLTPVSLAELEARLRNRGSEPEDVLQQRLSVAREEIAHSVHFDYLLISSSREEDLRRMQSVVDAEKMRSCRVVMPDIL